MLSYIPTPILSSSSGNSGGEMCPTFSSGQGSCFSGLMVGRRPRLLCQMDRQVVIDMSRGAKTKDKDEGEKNKTTRPSSSSSPQLPDRQATPSILPPTRLPSAIPLPQSPRSPVQPFRAPLPFPSTHPLLQTRSNIAHFSSPTAAPFVSPQAGGRAGVRVALHLPPPRHPAAVRGLARPQLHQRGSGGGGRHPPKPQSGGPLWA